MILTNTAEPNDTQGYKIWWQLNGMFVGLSVDFRRERTFVVRRCSFEGTEILLSIFSVLWRRNFRSLVRWLRTELARPNGSAHTWLSSIAACISKGSLPAPLAADICTCTPTSFGSIQDKRFSFIMSCCCEVVCAPYSVFTMPIQLNTTRLLLHSTVPDKASLQCKNKNSNSATGKRFGKFCTLHYQYAIGTTNRLALNFWVRGR